MVNLSDHSEQPRAILVGLNTNQSAERYAASMHELAELARSLDLEVADQVVQNAPEPVPFGPPGSVSVKLIFQASSSI